MGMVVAGLKQLRKKVGLRWRIAAFHRERNRMLVDLGQRTFSIYQKGELQHETLRNDCREIESLGQELEAMEYELINLQPGGASLTCFACGEIMGYGSRFCPQCGEKVTGSSVCSQCYKSLQKSNRFCPQCGTPVDKDEEAE
ncbi:MAG TPA: zinc ribbon domain-containing protein [Atribacteraceae bacterium]|nr:zinc ribbon domain-containing protein [Atribacteraceae bacterium]